MSMQIEELKPIYNHPKKMFKGTFYNNKDAFLIKTATKYQNQQGTMLITQIDSIEKQTLLISYFHDLFRQQPSIIGKHLIQIFQSTLNFTIEQGFRDDKKVCFIDLTRIYLERNANTEELKLFYAYKQSSEIICNDYLTQHHVLIINLYLQINLMIMCITSKDTDDDDDRQIKIKEHKDRNSKFIEYIFANLHNNDEGFEGIWKALKQKIKSNCDNACFSLQRSRLKNKSKGLSLFVEVLYNFIKNYRLSYLIQEDQNDKIGVENLRWYNFINTSNSQSLYREIMTINKTLKETMLTRQPMEDKVNDNEDLFVEVSISDEFDAVYGIIQQEYKNQKEFTSIQYVNVKEKINKTKVLIEQIFNKNKSTIFNSVVKDDQYTITFKMLDHFDHFVDLCIIKLKKDSFKCTIHFCRENYEPIIIPDKLTRSQISRLFIKKVCKIGGFVINPLSGQITFSYCTHNHMSKYTGKEFDTFLNRVIKNIFTSAYYMINFAFLTLAVKIGLISIPLYKDLESMVKKNDKIKKERVLFLHDTVICRLNNTIDLLENSTKSFSEFREEQLYQQNVMKEDKAEIEKQIDVYNQDKANEDDSQLELFEIIEFDESKKKRISGGGFSEIYAVELQFRLIEQKNYQHYGFQDQHNTGNYLSTFAMKVLRKEIEVRDAEKIEKEIQIIRQIKPKCKYVARYFYDQYKKKDHLFMELYYFTLGSYAHFHNSIMSLNTRLHMTLQVAQGVKFLQHANIYHLDLKPPNILLDDELAIKICDFGESYSQTIHTCVQNFQKTGRTLPYSPIESLQSQGNNFSSASDIYSIGAIISEIVFEKRLIEFKRINQQKLQQKLISRNYRLIYSDLVIKEFGIKQIMKILKVLMFKCVNPEPTCRPHIEYIIAIIHLLIQVLNDLY